MEDRLIQRSLFITGAQRSGTTLLSSLFDQVPGVSVLSQPFPYLFVNAKRAFLQSVGVEELRYPLGHLFQEDRYEPDQFASFLRRWRTSRESLADMFGEMSDYSGQYTRFTTEQINTALAAFEEGADFVSAVSQLARLLATRAECSWYGSKETTCEEFLPALLDRGFRCILILRDPRDIIASLNHGRGHEFGGQIKPTLFNIRSWRKSVAHALALDGHTQFQWCRYEDLVRDASVVRTKIADALGLPKSPVEAVAPSPDAAGWRGNSSHGDLSGITDRPIGTGLRILKRETLQIIEALCLPELQSLGYRTTLTANEAFDALRQMTEPYPSTRAGMEADSMDRLNIELEVDRLARLSNAPGSESRSWFLFERAHERLREGFLA